MLRASPEKLIYMKDTILSYRIKLPYESDYLGKSRNPKIPHRLPV